MLLHSTLIALARHHCERHPGRTAFIDGERALTYAEFDALGNRAAHFFAAQGIGAGDRVALWCVNRIEWLAALFGLGRLGAAAVAVNTRFRSAELQYLLEKSRARLLVLQRRFRSIDFPGVLAGVDPRPLTALEGVAVLDEDATATRVLDRPTLRFDLQSVRAAPPIDRSDPEAVAVLFTTSGTTRGPKLVMHPQRTLARHSFRVALDHGFTAPDSVLLASLPWCGVYGLNSTLGAFAAGAPIVLMDTFDAPAAAALIERHAVTHVYGSDDSFRRLLEERPGPKPFPSARLCAYAAFQPGATEFAESAATLGLPMTGLYGSSEVQALFSLQPASLPVAERVQAGGRPASPESEVRVRDVETGGLLPPGVSGELEIRAPTNFVGYLDNPEATAEAHTRDGFFRTGDIGRLRPDGTFVYETRRGDALRLGGFMVSPFEIEDTLKHIPGVVDVQIVGVELKGERRAAAFVIREPGGSLDAAAFTLAAKARVANYKVPARVWFVEEFPTTPSANGTKVQRAKLREMAMERLAAE